jgi:hypothetical protein
MKNFLKNLITIIALLIAVYVLFCPIHIVLITWNFWYLFLFFVTWIPATIFAKIALFIIDNV